MSEKVININDVLDITKDGIIFKNEIGETDIILFDECRRNWFNHVNQGGFENTEKNPIQITFEETNCIGERNMIAKPPYLLLYSDKTIKIVLKPKSIFKFTKVQKNFFPLLYRFNVNTFDMT